MRRRLLMIFTLVVVTMIASVAVMASGQEESQATDPSAVSAYPQRTIMMVVPYNPGGGSDRVARLFAERATELLGQEFRFDYRPGGSGAVGVRSLSDAETSGYVIGTFNTPHIITQPLSGVGDYDYSDFDFLGQIAADPMVLAVSRNSPYQSFDDFIEDARNRPGRINVGISGMLTSAGLATLAVIDQTGIDVNLVNFDSGSEVIANTLGGHVDVGASGLPPYMGSREEARFLAVTSERRTPLAPEIPTLRELDIDFSITTGRIFIAPKGLDPTAKEKLRGVIDDLNNDPDFGQALSDIGMIPHPMSGAELEDSMAELQVALRRIVERFGLLE